MFVQTSAESAQKTTKKPVEDKELLKEIQDEQKADELRKVRDDLVVRFWGSESELTKEAYADVMRNSENKSVVVANHPDITNMKQLKDIIVQLKLKMRSGSED